MGLTKDGVGFPLVRGPDIEGGVKAGALEPGNVERNFRSNPGKTKVR